MGNILQKGRYRFHTHDFMSVRQVKKSENLIGIKQKKNPSKIILSSYLFSGVVIKYSKPKILTG